MRKALTERENLGNASKGSPTPSGVREDVTYAGSTLIQEGM